MRIVHFTQPANRSLSPLFNTNLAALAAFENELSRLLSSAQTSSPVSARPEAAPVDLFEDKNNLFVRAELPGVRREDINVEVVDGYLTLQASRKRKVGDKEESFSLSRSICLTDEVRDDGIAAAFENGVLTVTLPKKEEAKPRRISVSVN